MIETLDNIQRRVLWLAVRMVDHANRERPPGEIKVGGHQASSASMIGIMTALWFGHLSGDDKVAVKPHASPVYHAIKYLTGELDRSYLTRLRDLGGLQSYPSRTKDPDVFDFSTGSVGLGVVAPLFAAATRRYLDAHFGAAPPARFIALAGDAELDEGNVWEAITDPSLQGLGNVMLVVDTNRQSLDRVVPDQKIKKLMEFFDGAGWHVVEAKYGRLLAAAFERPGGDALRHRIDEMSNEEYQSLFAHRGADLRERFLAGADAKVVDVLADISDDDLAPLVQNLGGHDLDVLLDAYRGCDAEADRPSVVFAYTVKGWGLPIAGDPLNHSALLSATQIDELRASLGLTVETEWDRFDPESPEGRMCATTGGELNNVPVPLRPVLPIPEATGVPAAGATSTQESFGRILTRLGDVEGVAERIVTTSPDVSVSTNLGGWINKVGVFTPAEATDYLGEDRLLRWRQSPSGRHIELGISEMNLFLLLQALGFGHDLHGEHLLPIGTVYDPFVCRGLDALGLRPLLRLALRGRRHARRHHARPGGRRPSVDHHPVDRLGAAGPDVRRAGLRPSPRLAALRRTRRARPRRRRLAVPAPVDAPDRPAPVRRRRSTAPVPSSCAPTCSPAATASSNPARQQPSCWRRAGRVVPEVLAAATALDDEGRPPSCST